MTTSADKTSSDTASSQTQQSTPSSGASAGGAAASAARATRGAVRGMGFAEGDAYLQPASAAARHAPASAAARHAPEGAVQAKEGAARDRAGRLPQALGEKMSRSFGADVSDVRVHEDGQADAIGAKAFTRGDDVHFARGAYDPASESGQALIGHELAHVVQQRAGRVRPGGPGAEGAQAKASAAGVRGRVNADPSLEAEADALGARAARGEPAKVPGASGAGASGEVLQGFFPAFSGLGGMVAKALARDGAIRLAKESALAIVRAQLPALQEQAVAAARAAVMSSPDVQRAMAQLGRMEEVQTLIEGLVAPVSARISSYLSERADAVAEALRAQLPDVAPLIPTSVREQAAAVRERLGALLPTELMQAAKRVVLESATAGLVAGAVHKAGELVSGSVVEGAVGAAKTAGEAAITPFVDAGREAMSGAQALVDQAGAVADMIPGMPGQGLVNKATSAATEALVPAPKLSDLAGDVGKIAEAPKAALVEQGDKLRQELQAKGKARYAEKLGQLIQIYTVTRDVTEAKNAEEGINAVLKAGAGWLGAAAGAAIGARAGAKGTSGAMFSATAGAAIGVALNLALEKVNIGGHLAGAGRALGRQEGVVGTAARGAYVGGKAVVDAARLPVRGIGVLWGGVKSLATWDSKHVNDSLTGVGQAWNTLTETGASARKNMDPAQWKEPPKPAGGGRKPPTMMQRLARAQKLRAQRAAAGGGAAAGGSVVASGGATSSAGARPAGARRARPRPKPEGQIAIDLSGVEAAVNTWQAGLIAALEGAATPEAGARGADAKVPTPDAKVATPDAKGATDAKRGGLDVAAMRSVRTEGLGMFGAMRRTMQPIGGAAGLGLGLGPAMMARTAMMSAGGTPKPAATPLTPAAPEVDEPTLEEVD